MNKFWYAVALLVASIVGIGFFGIPYTFAQAGFGVGMIFFVALVLLVVLTNLIYGEVVLRTHQRHQFVGFVHSYLGNWARKLNLFTFWVSVYGAIIGILIINGEFLSQLLRYVHVEASPVLLATMFLVLMTILVSMGLRTVSHVDFILMGVVVVIIALISLAAFPKLQMQNFSFSTGLPWFLPFGVILFSLNGTQGIPLMREVLIGKEHMFRKAILYGTMIPAVLYLFFTVSIVGVTGSRTVPEAIPGLVNVLGDWVVVLGSLFGFLTSSTIFMSVAAALKRSLHEDFHFRKGWQFPVAILPPFLLFLGGVQNFVSIIGLVGGVAISIDMILLLFVYARAKDHGTRIPEYSMKIPNAILYVMMILFACGALYTLIA